jgi:integrase
MIPEAKMDKATPAALVEINKRLEQGEGGISYRNSGTKAEPIWSKFLYYSFYRNGKQVFVNSKTNDVEEAYRQLLAAKDTSNRGVAVLPEESSRISYEQMRDRYLSHDEKAAKRNSYSNKNKISHLDAFFNGMKITRIDADMIEAYKKKRRANGIAGPTIRRELIILRSMFNELRKAKKVSADQVPHFEMPKDSKAAGRYIEPAEFAKIASFMPDGTRRGGENGGPKSDSNLVPFFSFIYSTGCRLGAAQKLTWGMVVEHDGVLFIDIPGSLTKNGEDLSLPLAGAILEPLADDLRNRRRELRKEFRDIDGELLFDSTNFRPEWAKAAAKAAKALGNEKLGTWDTKTRTRTGVRIHDCRASAAINLLSSGVEEALVLRIGGWKTRAMLDRYVGAGAKSRSKLIDAMKKGGTYVNDLMKKTAAK